MRISAVGAARGYSHALRRALHTPVATAFGGLTLGLALGASALAFAVLYGYLFRPLPYANPTRLYVVRQRLVNVGMRGPLVSVRFYRRLKRLPEFHDSGLFTIDDGTVTVGGRNVFAHFSAVTPSIFPLLNVKPFMGRALSEASELPDGPHEVVLSYGLWQRAFAASARVLGQSLIVGGTPMRIVGVMPRNFVFPIPHTEFWAPFVITPRRLASGNINYEMLMRMPPGWTLTGINSVLKTVRNAELHRETQADQARAKKDGYVIDAIAYRRMLLSYAGGVAPFWGLFGFTLLLLLMAVVNSTSLALTRQRRRLGEMSLRKVLGAGNSSVARLIVLEHLPEWIIMVATGVTVAVYCIRLLHAHQLPSPYMPFEIRFDAVAAVYVGVASLMVFLCIAGSSVGASLLSRPSASAVQEIAQRGSAGRAFRNAQRAMASAQICIALVLVVCGALVTRSLIGLLNQPLHFQVRRLTVASVMLPRTIHVATFWRQARTALREIPCVQTVALGHMVPFGESAEGGTFYPEGHPEQRTWAWMPIVSPGFFNAMGAHLLAGRDFAPRDAQPKSHSVIVSVALARALFGHSDVVGEELDQGMRIVGVAPTLPWKLDPASDHEGYAVYVPVGARRNHYVHVLIRSDASPGIVMSAVRRVFRTVAPAAAIYRMRTLRQMMNGASLNREAFAWLVAGFGVLAFLMAVSGTYAIVAYGTRLRLFEFALRQVLGATRGKILALALRETAALLLIGGAVGVAVTYVVVGGLRSMLYGVSGLVPWALLLALALIGMSVLLAAALPVWRASRVSPSSIMIQ